MGRRSPSYVAYAVVEGDVFAAEVEVEAALGSLLTCCRLDGVHGGRAEQRGECAIIEPSSELIRAELRCQLAGGALHGPPASYALPLPASDPYVAFDASIVVDSEPSVVVLGLEDRRSTVVTATARTVMEGTQPVQVLVARGKLNLEPPVVAAYTWPAHRQGVELGVVEVTEAAELVEAAAVCERVRGYGLYAWGSCLGEVAERLRLRSVLMSLAESPVPAGAPGPSAAAYMARSWASIAYMSKVDPMALASAARSAGVASSRSLVAFRRGPAGGLELETPLPPELPLVVLLRAEGLVASVTVRGRASVPDMGWHSYSLECRSCWRPLA